MADYSTSREPMTLEEFIDIAVSEGFEIDPTKHGEQPGEPILVRATTRAIPESIAAYISAYPSDVCHSVFGRLVKRHDISKVGDQYYVSLRDQMMPYRQQTCLAEHVGFRGGSNGLVEEWDQGSIELRVLEGSYYDDDDEYTLAELMVAAENIVAYYDAEDPEVIEFLSSYNNEEDAQKAA